MPTILLDTFRDTTTVGVTDYDAYLAPMGGSCSWTGSGLIGTLGIYHVPLGTIGSGSIRVFGYVREGDVTAIPDGAVIDSAIIRIVHSKTSGEDVDPSHISMCGVSVSTFPVDAGSVTDEIDVEHYTDSLANYPNSLYGINTKAKLLAMEVDIVLSFTSDGADATWSAETEVTAYEMEVIYHIGIDLDPPIGTTFGGTEVTVSGFIIPDGSTGTLDGVAIPLTIVDGVATFTTLGHSPGPVDFVLTDPEANVYTTTFTYHLFPSYTPSGGDPKGGTLIRIKRWFHEEGDNTEFVEEAQITFDGLPATEITFIDVDNYTCKTPAHLPGSVDVVITNINALGLEMEYPGEYSYGLTLKAPFINAGPDKLAIGPAPSIVTVVAKTNAEIATFLWEQTGGPQEILISAPTSLTTNLTFPSYMPGVYTFRIKALLADLPYISDSMVVTIPVVYPPKIKLTGLS